MLIPARYSLSVVGLFCVTHLAWADTEAWKQHNLEGAQELAKGRLTEAERLFQSALDELRQAGGGKTDEAIILTNLGMLYQAAGKYAKAQGILLRALEIRETMPDVDERTLALTLLNLGRAQLNGGQFAAAAPILQRALPLAVKA